MGYSAAMIYCGSMNVTIRPIGIASVISSIPATPRLSTQHGGFATAFSALAFGRGPCFALAFGAFGRGPCAH